MRKYLFTIFRYSAVALLAPLAVGKFAMIGSHAPILYYQDPVFRVPFHHLLFLAACLESIVVFACLIPKLGNIMRARAVAWLSTNLLLYRIGLSMIDYHRPCSCMGSLAAEFHISTTTADRIMKVVLVYLLVGSYASLWFLRKHARNNVSFDKNKGASLSPAKVA